MDEREREKLRDILQGMAFGIDGVDREAAESLWDVSVRVEGVGSMAGLTRRSYWDVRARVTRDWWERFQYVWRGFAEMEYVPADVLRDIAAGCCDNAHRYWSDVKEVIVRLCDNPAIPHDLFCDLDRRFGGEGSDLPELGACNPRYANKVARRLILDRPEGFSDAHDVPHHILDGVTCGAVTDEDVLAFLCDPRSWPRKLASSVGIRLLSCARRSMSAARLGGSGLTRDGVLVYGRDSHPFDIFIYADLDCDVKERAVALLLGLALVSPHCGDRAGETVRSDCVSELFAEGFADGFLRGDACDSAELELAMRLSADVRSRVTGVLFGDGMVCGGVGIR